jgi:peptidoglycan/LPS O-acetylase OafA/YrhL
VLESLRGIAAFYVVLNHSRGWLWAGAHYLQHRGGSTLLDKLGAAINQSTRLGHEAVIIFFVLSGLSIGHSVTQGSSPLRLYKRRLFRLYPPM